MTALFYTYILFRNKKCIFAIEYARADSKMTKKYIDIDAVLEAKSPSLKKKMPSFIISYLKHIVHEDELNDFLSKHWEENGATFIGNFLGELGISYSVDNEDKLPNYGRKTFVCNHALGGLDGIVLLKMLCDKYGEAKAVVNDLLMYISPMKSLFIPVNVVSKKQDKETVNLIDECMASDTPILYFPAGKVSRRDGKGNIADLEWKKNFITKSIEHKRDIVPLYFDGRNSDFFYNLAYWRTKLGIRQNIEMLYLADEMYKNKFCHFNITVGDVISNDSLADMPAIEKARWIRGKCYCLAK